MRSLLVSMGLGLGSFSPAYAQEPDPIDQHPQVDHPSVTNNPIPLSVTLENQKAERQKPKALATSVAALAWNYEALLASLSLFTVGYALARKAGLQKNSADKVCGSSVALLSSTPIAVSGLSASAICLVTDAPREMGTSWLIDGPQMFFGMTQMAITTFAFAVGGYQAAHWFYKNVQSTSPVNAVKQADAARRFAMDPEVWSHFGRQQANGGFYTHASQLAATLANPLITTGPALVAFGYSTNCYFHNGDFSFAKFALILSPLTTVSLYRLARGSRHVNLGSSTSDELAQKLTQPLSLTNRKKILKRLEHAFGIPNEKWYRAKKEQFEKALTTSEQALFQAEKLPPIAQLNQVKEIRLAQSEYATYIDTPVIYPAESKAQRLLGKKLAGPLGLPTDAHNLFYTVAHHIKMLNVMQLQDLYKSQMLTPTDVLRIFLLLRESYNRTLFPRSVHDGKLAKYLQAAAMESTRRYANGTARPLEGLLIAWKDLGIGPDGVSNVGSKTARLTGITPSPILERLMDYGALVLPVNLVAAANGGSGMHAGFGYIPHPTRPGFDPAGSSSATAYVIGHPLIPVLVGLGSQTGGSVSAPAGACGLYGFIPAQGVISKIGIAPLATFLDRIGILGRHQEDTLRLARYLSFRVGIDFEQTTDHPEDQYTASSTRPLVAFQTSLLKAASPVNRQHVIQIINQLIALGYKVVSLDKEWDFLSEVPLSIYPIDAYSGAAIAHVNLLQDNFIDPPRYTIDTNLLQRFPQAYVAIQERHFDRARALSEKLAKTVIDRFGADTILLSPSPEAIPTELIFSGTAGAKLDAHDRITMLQNRVESWAQMNVPGGYPDTGILLNGPAAAILNVLNSLPTVSNKVTPEAPAPALA